MDLRYLKKIIRLLEQSKVDEIEVEEEGVKIRVARNTNNNAVVQPSQSFAPIVSAPSAQSSTVSEAKASAKVESSLHEVKSPIVGTFYRSSSPDAEPYVEVGQVVQKGTVLCIIEAMKLMNEIEADASGRIAKVCVENNHPVEYNQLLFLIEPS